MSCAAAKILVVDDNKMVRDTICDFLNFSGFKTISAKNGEQALVLMEQENPKMVITDILMPDKEGLSTIIDIHRHYAGTKIIAMSGGGLFNRNDILNSAKKLGADVAFEKPFDFDELIVNVRKLLELNT